MVSQIQGHLVGVPIIKMLYMGVYTGAPVLWETTIKGLSHFESGLSTLRAKPVGLELGHGCKSFLTCSAAIILRLH